jgi:hypothetical protein
MRIRSTKKFVLYFHAVLILIVHYLGPLFANIPQSGSWPGVSNSLIDFQDYPACVQLLPAWINVINKLMPRASWMYLFHRLLPLFIVAFLIIQSVEIIRGEVTKYLPFVRLFNPHYLRMTLLSFTHISSRNARSIYYPRYPIYFMMYFIKFLLFQRMCNYDSECAYRSTHVLCYLHLTSFDLPPANSCLILDPSCYPQEFSFMPSIVVAKANN